MKSNKFVEKFGWDAVIEAVKTTPIDHDFQSTDLEPILARDGSIIGFDCKVHTISHAFFIMQHYSLLMQLSIVSRSYLNE